MAIGRRNLKNNWSTTLQASAAAAATTLSLPQAWIDKLTAPDPSATEWYELTIDDGVQAPEIVRCTGKATGTVTVVRAQQGTVAVAWGAGAKVEIRVTAGLLSLAGVGEWVAATENLSIGAEAGKVLGSGTENTLIGAQAGMGIVGVWDNTCVGSRAGKGIVTGTSNTVLGRSAMSATDGTDVVAVGRGAGDPGGTLLRATYLGALSTSASGASDVVALGYGAFAWTNNTAVLGSATSRIADVYIGGGQRDTAAAQVTLQASAGSGTNKAGGTLRLAGGKGTGTGAGGKVLVATAAAGASGSAENALTNRAEWDTAGLFWTYGAIKTGNPGAGAGTWKLGTVQAGAVTLDTANYVEVDIGGSVVKLLKAA